jgi:hypothetical protein
MATEGLQVVTHPHTLWPPHQPTTNGSPTQTSIPRFGQASQELAQFNISEFLGTFSSHTEEGQFTFPETERNESSYKV